MRGSVGRDGSESVVRRASRGHQSREATGFLTQHVEMLRALAWAPFREILFHPLLVGDVFTNSFFTGEVRARSGLFFLCAFT